MENKDVAAFLLIKNKIKKCNKQKKIDITWKILYIKSIFLLMINNIMKFIHYISVNIHKNKMQI